MASKQQADPFYLSIPPWWNTVSHSHQPPAPLFPFSFFLNQPSLLLTCFPENFEHWHSQARARREKSPGGRRTGKMETKPRWFYTEAIFKGLGKCIPTSLRLGVLIIDKVQNKFTFFSITMTMQRVTRCNHRLNYKHAYKMITALKDEAHRPAWVFTRPVLSELSASLFRYHLFENAALTALTALFGKAYLFKCKISC